MSKVLILVLLFSLTYGLWRGIRKLWVKADISEQKEQVIEKEDQFDDVKEFMKDHKVPKSFGERMRKFFE